MAKSPSKPKPQRSAQSTTKRTAKNQPKTEGLPVVPCCQQLFEGKPYGTIPAAEDGGCRDIEPPQGTPPWVPFWHPNLNGNWPYWESLTNLEAAPGGGMQLKADVMEKRVAQGRRREAERRGEKPPRQELYEPEAGADDQR